MRANRTLATMFMASFACGVEATDGSTDSTQSALAKSPLPTPEEERIPIALQNPDANQGINPNLPDLYVGWPFALTNGYHKLHIAYDSTLNSNVFDIVTYMRGNPATSGHYYMYQSIDRDTMSESARAAIAEGYPIQCEAQMKVAYDVKDDIGPALFEVENWSSNAQIDACEAKLVTQGSWRLVTCGPIASVDLSILSIAAKCRSALHCNFDKFRCYVVKRAGFERWSPTLHTNLQNSAPVY